MVRFELNRVSPPNLISFLSIVLGIFGPLLAHVNFSVFPKMPAGSLIGIVLSQQIDLLSRNFNLVEERKQTLRKGWSTFQIVNYRLSVSNKIMLRHSESGVFPALLVRRLLMEVMKAIIFELPLEE